MTSHTAASPVVEVDASVTFTRSNETLSGRVVAIHKEGSHRSDPERGGTMRASMNRPIVAIETPDGVYHRRLAAVTLATEGEADITDFEDATVTDTGEWIGVLTVEGTDSGDGRTIEAGALTWRSLDKGLPLMLQTATPGEGGHAGAVLCGVITDIWREGPLVMGKGQLDMEGEHGSEAFRLMRAGMLHGVSVDMDSARSSFEFPELGPDADEFDINEAMQAGTEKITEARIMGATLCPFPAFQEAMLELIASGDLTVLVASAYGEPMNGSHVRANTPLKQADMESLVASATATVEMAVPSASWFAHAPAQDGAYATRVESDGRIHGYVAEWGTCHIGFTGKCVSPPRSQCSYSRFATGTRTTVDGKLVPTGRVFIGGEHAPTTRGFAADKAVDFYATTSAAVADVSVHEDEYGIYVAGAVRPDATAKQIEALRASDLSPDWRSFSGEGLEMVAILAVNCSGFNVPGLVASARGWTGEFDERGEITSLVASGAVYRSPVEARIERLEARVDAQEAFRSTFSNAETAEEAHSILRELGVEVEADKSVNFTDKLPVGDKANCARCRLTASGHYAAAAKLTPMGCCNECDTAEALEAASILAELGQMGYGGKDKKEEMAEEPMPEDEGEGEETPEEDADENTEGQSEFATLLEQSATPEAFEALVNIFGQDAVDSIMAGDCPASEDDAAVMAEVVGVDTNAAMEAARNMGCFESEDDTTEAPTDGEAVPMDDTEAAPMPFASK
jgi:hypothetical protein